MDFWLILRNYGDPCHRERLLLEEDETLAAEDHDVSRAGARLLGSDMSQILDGKGTAFLIRMITAELDDSQSRRLLNVAVRQTAAEDECTQLRELLRAVVRGLTRKTKSPTS